MPSGVHSAPAPRFTLPDNAKTDHVYVYAVMKGISGTARFDNLQLEEGDVGGRRNLVENNGFLYGEERFERSASLGSGDGIVNADGSGAMPAGKAFAITGDPQTDKRISQTIPLAGSEGDTFVISGGGCAETVPPKDGRKFGVELTFVHTDGTTEDFYAGFAS